MSVGGASDLDGKGGERAELTPCSRFRLIDPDQIERLDRIPVVVPEISLGMRDAEKLGSYISDLGEQLNRALAENVRLDEALRRENETVEMYETALMEAMGKLRSLSAQIKALGRRIGDALGGEAPAEGIEALEGALGQLIAKKEALEGEVGQLKGELARSEENLGRITSAKGALEVKVSQLGDQLGELREKNASLGNENSQLSSRVGELEASVKELRVSLDETNRTLQTAEASLAEAKNKITQNENLIARLESQLAEADATLKSAREKVVKDLEGVLRQGSKTVRALGRIAAGRRTEAGKAARVEGRLTQKVISATGKKRAAKSENAKLQEQKAELEAQYGIMLNSYKEQAKDNIKAFRIAAEDREQIGVILEQINRATTIGEVKERYGIANELYYKFLRSLEEAGARVMGSPLPDGIKGAMLERIDRADSRAELGEIEREVVECIHIVEQIHMALENGNGNLPAKVRDAALQALNNAGSVEGLKEIQSGLESIIATVGRSKRTLEETAERAIDEIKRKAADEIERKKISAVAPGGGPSAMTDEACLKFLLRNAMFARRLSEHLRPYSSKRNSTWARNQVFSTVLSEFIENPEKFVGQLPKQGSEAAIELDRVLQYARSLAENPEKLAILECAKFLPIMENKKGAIVGCKFANSRLTLFLLGAINALPEDVKKLKDFRGNEVEPLVTVALEKIINDGDFMANEFVYHAIRELAKDPFLCDEAKAIVDRVEAKITLKTSVGYSGLRENIKAEKARIGEIKGTIGDLNGKIKAEKARIGELGKAINDEEGRKPRPDQGKIDELNREKREAEARVDRLEKAVEERKKIGGIGTAALRDLYISGDVLDSVTMAAINEFNKSTTMLTQSIAQIKTGSLAAIDSVDASEGKASFGDVAGDAVGIVSRITAKGVDRIGSAMQNMRSLGDVVVDFGFEVYQRMLDSTIAEGEKLKNDSRTFSRNAGEDLPYTRSNFVEQCKNAKAKVREEINRLVSGTLKLLNSPKNVDKDTVLAAMKHYGEQIINDLSQWLIVQTKTTPNTSGIHYDYEKIPQKPLIPLNEEDGCLLLPPNFQTTADTQVPPPPTVEEVARKPTGAQPPAAQSPKQAAPAKPVGTLKKAAGKPTEVQPPATQPPPATPTGKPTETSKTPFGLKKKVAGSSSKV